MIRFCPLKTTWFNDCRLMCWCDVEYTKLQSIESFTARWQVRASIRINLLELDQLMPIKSQIKWQTKLNHFKTLYLSNNNNKLHSVIITDSGELHGGFDFFLFVCLILFGSTLLILSLNSSSIMKRHRS